MQLACQSDLPELGRAIALHRGRLLAAAIVKHTASEPAGAEMNVAIAAAHRLFREDVRLESIHRRRPPPLAAD